MEEEVWIGSERAPVSHSRVGSPWLTSGDHVRWRSRAKSQYVVGGPNVVGYGEKEVTWRGRDKVGSETSVRRFIDQSKIVVSGDHVGWRQSVTRQ